MSARVSNSQGSGNLAVLGGLGEFIKEECGAAKDGLATTALTFFDFFDYG